MRVAVNASERCDSAADGAALGLLGLMSGISEEYWCASWLSGLEFDLWDAATCTNRTHLRITSRQATLLRLLSEECDGWWHWKDEQADNPQFVSLAEWNAIVEKVRQSSGA